MPSGENEPREILDRAYDCLEDFETEKALELGNQLIEMNFSGGYEITAQAYMQNEDPEKAIKILEKGVKEFPSIWLIWNLLGNLYSDNEEFDKSLDCYEQALSCPENDETYIRINQSIVLTRRDRFEEAIAVLPTRYEDGMFFMVEPIRLFNLNHLRKYDEVCGELEEVESRVEKEFDETLELEVSRTFAELAWAFKKTDQNDHSKELALRSLSYDKMNSRALETVREINNKREAGSKRYVLIVKGKWHEPFEGESDIPGFLSTFEVIAEDQKSALSFIKELEPQEVRDSLEVNEEEEESDAPTELQGIYWRTGYIFFSKE